ncbi:MAG TPA: hypothetical protein VGH86_04045 [Phenylobacterium sp.]|jgi:hypothetical protein
MGSKPNLVRNSPGLLNAVALVAPTHVGTLRNIRNMARGAPPALYRTAVEIVLATLRGRALGWGPDEAVTWAKSQAAAITDDDKRKCAEDVVHLLRPYFRAVRPAWVQPLSIEYYQAGPGLQIPVKLSALMSVDDRFVVLVLHLWRKPLSLEQRHAAAAILHNRLQQRPELENAEMHLVDISVPEGHTDRQYRLGTWENSQMMPPEELKVFTDRFYVAWQAYLADPEPKPPRKPRSSSTPDLFGDDPPEPPK